MPSKKYFLGFLLSATGLMACNDNEFQSSPGKKSVVKTDDAKESPVPDSDPQPTIDPTRANTTIAISKDANTIGDPFKVPPGALNLKIESDAINSTDSAQKVYPKLGIYFVIDRSSSMGPQLQSAKNGIQDFASALKTNGFEASFGAITFEDPVQDRIKLTDLESFKKSLSAVTLSNNKVVNGYFNSDIPEGGLGALLAASESLEAELAESDAVPILVYISDATAHQGSDKGLAVRYCSPEPFLNSLQTEFGKRIKFFYSVNTQSITPLSSEGCNFPTVNVQYDGIMKQLQDKSAGDYRGAKLSWPFNETVLSKELPKFLKEKIVKIDQLCRATDIILSADGQAVNSWTQDDFKNREGNSIVFSEVLADDNLEKLRDADFKLDISRCCDANPSTSCQQPIKQTVAFRIAG